MQHLTGHQLGRRLLELPDHVLLTANGDFITEAFSSTYDDDKNLDLPCINLEVSSE